MVGVMAKANVVIVGEAGDKTLYIIFKEGDKALPNSLFRLQHPGMEIVERWNNSVIQSSGDDVKIQTVSRTKNFFKDCVFPVETPMSDLESSLVDKYGANSGGKLNPEKVHPKFIGIWQRVSSRFLDGSLWDEIPEPEQSSE